MAQTVEDIEEAIQLVLIGEGVFPVTRIMEDIVTVLRHPVPQIIKDISKVLPSCATDHGKYESSSSRATEHGGHRRSSSWCATDHGGNHGRCAAILAEVACWSGRGASAGAGLGTHCGQWFLLVPLTMEEIVTAIQLIAM